MRFIEKMFRRKRAEVNVDLGILHTDIHSHLIPGIDDGAQDIKESIELISELKKLGYRKLITTPHIMTDLYPNKEEDIRQRIDLLQKEVDKRSLGIQLEAAAEYLVDHDFETKLNQGHKFLTFGDNYILIEFSFVEAPINLDKIIFELQVEGYRPVIAHIERYPYWHEDFKKIFSLFDKGVALQLNISSLSGAYGPDVAHIAEKLIERNMISFLGSDCHNQRHISTIQSCLKNPALYDLIESGNLKNPSL